MDKIINPTHLFKIIKVSVKSFTLFLSIPTLLMASYNPIESDSDDTIIQNPSHAVHQSVSHESVLHKEDQTPKTYKLSYLNVLPIELMLQILQYLPITDLNHLGAASKDLKVLTDDQTLWWPLYQKARLVPYQQLSSTINPHVTSYKYLMIAVHEIQKALMKGQEPNYEALMKLSAQAFQNKVWLYQVFSKIYSLKSEQNQAQVYLNKFRLLCLNPRDFNCAVYSGLYGCKEIPEIKRFNLLKLREQSGDEDAQKWIDEALFAGQLGQQHRSLTERLVDIKQRIEAGNHHALQRLIYKIAHDYDFAQHYGTESECFNFLEYHSHQGHPYAQQFVIEALYQGKLGQHHISENIRFEKLKKHADLGNIHAQTYVEQTLQHGTLGHQKYTEQERFEILSSLSWNSARALIIHILTEGSLGQGTRSVAERLQEIERLLISERLDQIRYYPSMIDMIFNGQGLDQENVADVERFAHLKHLAANGIRGAELYIVKALYEGQLGQGSRSAEERFAELVRRAQCGSDEAARALVDALCYGELSQDLKSTDQRYYALQHEAEQGNQYAQESLPKIIKRCGFVDNRFADFMDGFILHDESNDQLLKLSNGLLFTLRQNLAKQGDKIAQQWLNKIFYEDTYGQNCYTPLERFAKLHVRALENDHDAENYIVKALINGELGQSQKLPSERFKALDFWAHRNNSAAQQTIARAIRQGTFAQDQLSNSERLQALKDRGQQGNTYAYDILIDILLFGQLEQYQRSPQARFHDIEVLAESSHQKAQQVIVQLLIKGIKGFYDDIHGQQYRTDFLGNDRKTDSERFNKLKTYALSGNSYARKTLIDLSPIFLTSPEDHMNNLLFWAALGDYQAQQLIVNDRQLVLKGYSQNLKQLYEFLSLMIQPGSNMF